MVPIRGCSRGSTTRVREVPIASGWPGQSSANALWLARPATNARQMAVDRPARNPTEPLLIRTHRLTDHDASPAFLTHARWRHLSRRPKFVSQLAAMVHGRQNSNLYRPRCECSLNDLTFTGLKLRSGRPVKVDAGRRRNDAGRRRNNRMILWPLY